MLRKDPKPVHDDDPPVGRDLIAAAPAAWRIINAPLYHAAVYGALTYLAITRHTTAVVLLGVNAATWLALAAAQWRHRHTIPKRLPRPRFSQPASGIPTRRRPPTTVYPPPRAADADADA